MNQDEPQGDENSVHQSRERPTAPSRKGGEARAVDRPSSAPETGLSWAENRNRESGQVHVEWHAPCGCAFHPKPFPHVHPCTNEHKRPDLHTLTQETERERVLRRRRALMPDYDKRLEDWLS